MKMMNTIMKLGPGKVATYWFMGSEWNKGKQQFLNNIEETVSDLPKREILFSSGTHNEIVPNPHTPDLHETLARAAIGLHPWGEEQCVFIQVHW
jgi:predicted esterase